MTARWSVLQPSARLLSNGSRNVGWENRATFFLFFHDTIPSRPWSGLCRASLLTMRSSEFRKEKKKGGNTDPFCRLISLPRSKVCAGHTRNPFTDATRITSRRGFLCFFPRGEKLRLARSKGVHQNVFHLTFCV